MITTSPTVPSFRRIVAELAMSPEDLAAQLNQRFFPDVNLSSFDSYQEVIYISNREDKERLDAYAQFGLQSLGEMLFFARKDLKRNWTLEEAAKQPPHLPVKTLRKIEMNRHPPSDLHLGRLAQLFGLDETLLRRARARTYQQHHAAVTGSSPSKGAQ